MSVVFQWSAPRMPQCHSFALRVPAFFGSYPSCHARGANGLGPKLKGCWALRARVYGMLVEWAGKATARYRARDWV
eukprot:11083590-Alexandrium_andersonii.AAC.1